MFRTIIINNGEIASLKENWLVVSTFEGEKKVPVNDIYSLVVDNQQIKLTVSVLNRLTESGAHVILCDNKHIPATIILPNSNYYRPLSILKLQISMLVDFKGELWRRVVKQKLLNQAEVMRFAGIQRSRVERVIELAESVYGDDDGNCEAIGAKMFFRDMYGSEFIRNNDDTINAALNYGYAIIRSAVAKTLVSHGFNCAFGLHHINEFNAFNLADDLMEPLRPIVDYWVYWNQDDLIDELSKDNRQSLVNLVNVSVILGNRKMALRNAIEDYIVSFSKACKEEKSDLLVIPKMFEKCFNNYG